MTNQFARFLLEMGSDVERMRAELLAFKRQLNAMGLYTVLARPGSASSLDYLRAYV